VPFEADFLSLAFDSCVEILAESCGDQESGEPMFVLCLMRLNYGVRLSVPIRSRYTHAVNIITSQGYRTGRNRVILEMRRSGLVL